MELVFLVKDTSLWALCKVSLQDRKQKGYEVYYV